MGMTLDEVGRIIAEGSGSREMLRRVIEEFGMDPVPWNVLNAGRAYGWSAERTLGALALFLCWHQRETGRLREEASSLSMLPTIPPR
jgi:hypothetical protein